MLRPPTRPFAWLITSFCEAMRPFYEIFRFLIYGEDFGPYENP